MFKENWGVLVLWNNNFYTYPLNRWRQQAGRSSWCTQTSHCLPSEPPCGRATGCQTWCSPLCGKQSRRSRGSRSTSRSTLIEEITIGCAVRLGKWECELNNTDVFLLGSITIQLCVLTQLETQITKNNRRWQLISTSIKFRHVSVSGLDECLVEEKINILTFLLLWTGFRHVLPESSSFPRWSWTCIS